MDSDDPLTANHVTAFLAGAARPERRHGSEMPRSRQIFLANGSGISVWRGTAERRLLAGLPYHE